MYIDFHENNKIKGRGLNRGLFVQIVFFLTDLPILIFQKFLLHFKNVSVHTYLLAHMGTYVWYHDTCGG